MADNVNLYNPHDGLTGRDGGPYLDQEERRLAEIVRAAKEDRKPDFDSAPAVAGTPLVTSAELVGMANPASNPSQMNTVDAMTNAVDTLAKEESFPVNAFASRDKTDAEKEATRLSESTDPHDNPANPTVISTDEKDNAPLKETSSKDSSTSTPAKKTAASKSSDK